MSTMRPEAFSKSQRTEGSEGTTREISRETEAERAQRAARLSPRSLDAPAADENLSRFCSLQFYALECVAFPAGYWARFRGSSYASPIPSVSRKSDFSEFQTPRSEEESFGLARRRRRRRRQRRRFRGVLMSLAGRARSRG